MGCALGRRHGARGEQLLAGQQALALQVFAEAGAARQHVIQQLVLHKGTAPRLDSHQAIDL